MRRTNVSAALLRWLVLLLAALPAAAQQCETKSLGNPAAPGSHAALHAGTAGAAARWWCPGTVPGTWVATGWAGLWADQLSFITTVVPRVLGDPAPWTRFKAETAAVPVPAAGTLAACRLADLHQVACMKLVTASASGYPTLTTAQALAPGACGPVVDCSAVPVLPAVWRVGASGGTLYAVANGTRGAAIASRRAPANALCDCATFRVNLTAAGITATYCALAGGPATECTLCKQVPL